MSASLGIASTPENPKSFSEMPPSDAKLPKFPEETFEEPEGLPDEGDLRPLSERMADPRLIATMAMKEMADVLERYTTLSRSLHSDHLPSLANARSSMIQTYRQDYPELMAMMSGGDFDNEANNVFLKAFRENLKYIDNLKACNVLALFTPWLKSMKECRVRPAPPPTPYQSDHEEDEENA